MVTYPEITFSTVVFSPDQIRSVEVIEEFHPLSITVPINQLVVELFDPDPETSGFSIIDPSGAYELLEYRTPLTVVEYVDGEPKFIGRYYVDTWENVTENIIKIVCMDEIGLLDTTTYRGGIWLGSGVTVNTLIEDIFSDLSINYEMDPDLGEVVLYGWIPISTHREAIQQIMFAAGGYVLSARQNGYLKFGRIDAVGATTRGVRSGVPNSGQSRLWKKRFRQSQWEGVIPVIPITASEQSVTRKVNLRTRVTGVEVTQHDISPGTASRTLFDGLLGVGTWEIRFSQPMHTLTITGAVIYESGANYAILTVSTAQNVLLEGKVYIDTTSKIGHYTTDPGAVKENIITINEGSLVNSNNGATIAERVFNYYQTRHVQELKLIRPYVYIGTKVELESLYGRYLEGFVEKMTLDLTGGFIGKTTVIGDPMVVT